MNSRPFRILLIAALMSLLALATACGDDGKKEEGGDGGGEALTLEEYFAEVNDIQNQFTPDRRALENQYPNAFDDLEETRSLFSGAVPLLRDLVTSLSEINPPAEVESVHDRAVTAATDSADLLEDIAAQLEDVQTDAEFEEVLADVPELTSLTSVLQGFRDACEDAQKIADDNNIGVDLTCEEEIQP